MKKHLAGTALIVLACAIVFSLTLMAETKKLSGTTVIVIGSKTYTNVTDLRLFPGDSHNEGCYTAKCSFVCAGVNVMVRGDFVVEQVAGVKKNVEQGGILIWRNRSDSTEDKP